jgi:MraZ protein
MDARASYADFFEHAFDPKGRITVPSDWRQDHFEKSLYVFPSDEGCLKVYPASWLGELQEKMAALKVADPQRKSIEALARCAQNVVFDTQHRITIKERLRHNAGLKKDVMLVGNFTHFQIWDKAVWDKQNPVMMTFEEGTARASL